MTIDRREDIIQAALEVFADKGFKNTKMDDIALEAGVSKGTVYLYFSSKQKLFMAMYGHLLTQFSKRTGALIQEPDQSPPERIRAMMQMYVNIMQENPKVRNIVVDMTLQALQNEALYELAKDNNHQAIMATKAILEAGIEQGYFREDIDIHYTAIAIQSGAAGVIQRVVIYPEWDVAESMNAYLDLVLGGLKKKDDDTL